MSTIANSVVVDEATKTVTIRQVEFTLHEKDFMKGYHHVIYASTVHVKKGFVNPGRNLTIYAAQIVGDRNGGQIDVSGAPGSGYAPDNRRSATGHKQNSYDGDNGFDGQDGGPGENSGDVTIHAGRIVGGAIGLTARGGAGGRAQDGGHGWRGETPPERARPSTPKQVVVGYEVVEHGNHYTRVPKYGWGSDTLKIGNHDFWAAWLYVTHQAPRGADGGNGGNAGLAGKPGDGGKGGKIRVRSLLDPKEFPLGSVITGGAAGESGRHGNPGNGADGGLGAKFLYHGSVKTTTIDWSAYDEKNEWDENWNTKNSTTFWVSVDHFDNLSVNNDYIDKYDGTHKKLKLRNGSGNRGRNGGYGPTGLQSSPAARTASRGAEGSHEVGRTEMNGAAYRDIPYPYLLMLQRSLTAATLNGDNDKASIILRWLMLLTASFRNAGQNASEDEQNRQRIHLQSEHALLTLDRDTEGHAAVCIYTDIERYSAFVKTSMSYIASQEEFFKRYQANAATISDRKEVLKGSIAELKTHIAHLMGEATTPGSILYCRDKESQIKLAIGGLDIKIMNFQYVLEHMPNDLKEEIDAKVREKSKLSVWDVLQFVGMAAGVAINFASAAGSIMTMVTKVKDFYKEALNASTWGDILGKDGIWNREFSTIRADLKELLDTKEWKAVGDDRKAFIGSVTDFVAKVSAYDEILKSRRSVRYTFDILDVQAGVLIFDTAKLELKVQRNAFEAFIVQFLEEYQKAREFKHVFSDYFDTSETRFDLLAHLAEVQAQRRDLEYQRDLHEKNLGILTAQLEKLDFDPEKIMGEDIRTSLEANLHMALDLGLNRIFDERRAYRIWSLQDHTLPPVPENLTAEILKTRFHAPLWDKIAIGMSSTSEPAFSDFSGSPYVWKREDYSRQFAELQQNKRMLLQIPVDLKANIYFQRIVNVRVFLRGATTTGGSPFYCVLHHRGVSEFLNRDRKIVTGYQQPRAIEFSYALEGTGSEARPNYEHQGAIQQDFDKRGDLARVRYSPFTTWELQIIPNYRQNQNSKVFNQDIDLSKLEAIELRFSSYYNTFHMPQLDVTMPEETLDVAAERVIGEG